MRVPGIRQALPEWRNSLRPRLRPLPELKSSRSHGASRSRILLGEFSFEFRVSSFGFEFRVSGFGFPVSSFEFRELALLQRELNCIHPRTATGRMISACRYG